MRVIFVCAPSRAYGEINSLVSLAKDVAAAGGDVWFLASPLAADLARSHFPDRVFQMSPEPERNQTTFWRIVRKFRPDLIVLSELYEILRPGRTADCPLIGPPWLREVAEVDCSLVFVDFIAHVPMLRRIAACDLCTERFGVGSLQAFLEGLQVILPCPLNEPGPVKGRCGIPYPSQNLPLTIEPDDRSHIRAKFMGDGHEEDGALVVCTGSSWQGRLADRYGVTLYQHLGDLLAAYLSNMPKPVTLVSISNHHKLFYHGSGVQLRNIGNLPPAEFDQLLLASDLLITDNEIAYTLAKTLGNVPGLVLVNSFTLDDVLRRERNHSPIRKIVLKMEGQRRDSIYPHKIFPIRAKQEELADEPSANRSGPGAISTLRLGRMISSPFVKAELYGGEETRRMFEWLLCDPSSRELLKKCESAYIARLSNLDKAVTVLKRLTMMSNPFVKAMHKSLVEHLAL